MKSSRSAGIIAVMKYAVIQVAGRQFRVQEGDELELDKIEQKEGERLDFDKVLLLVENGEIKIGRPYLSGVIVKAKVVSQFKGPKIRVATYKAKSRYRRVKGFRHQLTKVKIEKIEKQDKKKESVRKRPKIKKTAKTSKSK